MKKKQLLTALLAVVMAAGLLFGGCQKDPATESSEAAESTASTTAADSVDSGEPDSADQSAEEDSSAEDSGAATTAEESKNSGKNTTKRTSASTKQTGVVAEVDKYDTDGLKTVDMKGYTLKIALTSKSLIKNMRKKGDKDYTEPNEVTQLRYNALEKVEKRFNCTVTPVYYEPGKLSQTYSQAIMVSATNSVPQVILGSMWEAGNMMSAKLLTDFGQLKNVDMSKPWWNKAMAEGSKIGGKVYLGLSNITEPDVRSWYIAYNKKIAKSIGLTDAVLSDMVKNKTWTVDNFIAWSKKAVKDKNGDGKFTEKDQWGFAAPGTDFIYAMMASGGASFVDVDKSGKRIYGLNNDNAISVLEKINKIMCTEGIRYPVANNKDQMAAGTDGKVLFWGYQAHSILSSIREEGDIGILPMPIGGNRKDYEALVDHNCAVSMIPSTTKDLDKVGTLLEAMSFAYWKLIPERLELYKELYLEEGDTLSLSVVDGVFDRMNCYAWEFDNTSAFLKSTVQPILTACTKANADISGIVAAIKNPSQATINNFYGQK